MSVQISMRVSRAEKEKKTWELSKNRTKVDNMYLDRCDQQKMSIQM